MKNSLFLLTLMISFSSFGQFYEKLKPGALENYFFNHFENNFDANCYSFTSLSSYKTEVEDFVSAPNEWALGVSYEDFPSENGQSDFLSETKKIRVSSLPSEKQSYFNFRKSSIEIFLTRLNETGNLNVDIIKTLKLELFIIDFLLYNSEQSFVKKCQILKDLETSYYSLVSDIDVEDVKERWHNLVPIKNHIIGQLKEDFKTKLVCKIRPILGTENQKNKIKKIVQEAVVEMVTMRLKEKSEILDNIIANYHNIVKEIDKKTYLIEVIKLRDSLVNIEANLNIVKNDLFYLTKKNSDPTSSNESLLRKLQDSVLEFNELNSSNQNKKNDHDNEVEKIKQNIETQILSLISVFEGDNEIKSCKAIDTKEISSKNDFRHHENEFQKCFTDLLNKIQTLTKKKDDAAYWLDKKNEINQITKGLIKE